MLSVCAFQSALAHAQTTNWSGAESSDWNNEANWEGGSVPVAGTVRVNSLIPNSAVASGVTFNGNRLQIGSTMGSSGRLELINGSNFHFSGSVEPVCDG